MYIFVEFPKIAQNKMSLYVGRSTFKFRVFVRGYMSFMLTLWDNTDSPLLWWSRPGPSARHEWGKAIHTWKVRSYVEYLTSEIYPGSPRAIWVQVKYGDFFTVLDEILHILDFIKPIGNANWRLRFCLWCHTSKEK